MSQWSRLCGSEDPKGGGRAENVGQYLQCAYLFFQAFYLFRTDLALICAEKATHVLFGPSEFGSEPPSECRLSHP
eukprot:3285817-Rhodomonas_salina.4